MKTHLLMYIAHDENGDVVSGVARVHSPRSRPSWAECCHAIPGFIRGTAYLGVAGE